MSDRTVEEKLHLVQQLRAQTYENNHALQSRERILYGKQNSLMAPPPDSMTQEAQKSSSSFQIRFFLAVLLFAAFIVMDKNDIKVAGITMSEIEQVISADYEDKLQIWVETMSQ